MIRVLFTESSNAFGGQERRLLHEATLLRDAGHLALIACQPDTALFERAVAACFEAFAVRMCNSMHPPALLSICALIWRRKIQLVYSHSGKDSWIAGICARLTGIPLVRSRELLMPIRDRAPYNLLPKRVLACSNAVRQQLLDAGVHARKVVVQYPPVATRRFATAIAIERPAGRFPLLTYVARFMAEKRQSDLIRALPLLTKEYPMALLILVGSGPDLVSCKSLAGELNVADNVRFLGEREDVPAILAGADLFVLPSTTEPFGMAAVEAMAAGATVIVTQTGGLAEIVTDNVNGLLVPTASPRALAAAALRLCRDPQLRTRLAGEARRRAEDFSEQRALQSLLEHVNALAITANQQKRKLAGEALRHD